MTENEIKEKILSKWKKTIYGKHLAEHCLNILLSIVIKEILPLIQSTKDSCYTCKSYRNRETIKNIFKR